MSREQMNNSVVPWTRPEGVPPTDDDRIHFFGNQICPFAHRSFWAMFEKGLEAQTTWHHIDLGPTKPAWFREVSAYATVPMLVHGGAKVFDSSVINEYLEETFAGQGAQLMPTSTVDRATVRLFVKEWSDRALKAMYGLLRVPDDEALAAKAEETRTVMTWMETFYATQGGEGPFLFGEQLTIADMAWVPFVYRFQSTMKAFHDFDIWEGEYPRLRACFDASLARPAFQPTTASGVFFATMYDGYRAPDFRGTPWRGTLPEQEVPPPAAL